VISCQTFRATLQPGTEDPSLLEHLRSCDACLDFAMSVDPDYGFRSIGGGELTPPGGVDAFVDGVMAQVRSRQMESVTERLPLNRYLRAAAAVVFVIAGATGVYRISQQSAATVPVIEAAAVKIPLTTKPVVESYQSQNATVVEVPSSSDDAHVVMIFDESLPADL
jgi:hypothetical protein